VKEFKTDRCLGCYKPIDQEGLYHDNCSLRLFDMKTPPSLDNSIEQLPVIKKTMIANRLTITGVQKKLSLWQDPSDKKRLTIVGGLGGTYILKPQSDDYPSLPENEDLCMHLAELCGIKTAKHGLLPTTKGELAYVTKRFDRLKKQKLAVEDLCQLSQLQTEQKYRSSHERAGKIIKDLSSIPGDDVLRFYQLTLFSFITGNNDMHLKNFMLITNNPKKIVLSPAYDLLSIRLVLSKNDDPEELALSVDGRRNKLTIQNFQNLATYLGIPAKAASYALKKISSKSQSMNEMIDRSFLSIEKKEVFKELIETNLNGLSK